MYMKTKTLRVSEDTHARLMAYIASTRASSMDEAVSGLLSTDTVHLPLSPVQRYRWDVAAEGFGVPVQEFIPQCVEAIIHQGKKEKP